MTQFGQIIIINGTSGSGKSTTTELWAKTAEDFWLLYGIDHFLATSFPSKFGHHGPRCAEGIFAHPQDPDVPDGPLRWSMGADGLKAFSAFHEWIAATSRAGCNIIIDHLLMSEPPLLQDLIWRLQGLPVLLVTLKPSYAVLSERIAGRKMDKPLPVDLLGADAVAKIVDRLNQLRPWFYQSVYANPISDLLVDTELHSPSEVCAMIAARLAQGAGTALDDLRVYFPQS